MAKLSLQIDMDQFIEIETFGQPKNYQLFVKEFLEYLSKFLVWRIDEVIEKQLYSWSPLSASWKFSKKKLGLSPKQWVASGFIKDSIKYWHSRAQKTYIIGVHPYKKHREYKFGGVMIKKRNVLLVDVIRKLEFGSAAENLPARPLFSKVFREVEEDLSIHLAGFVKSIG